VNLLYVIKRSPFISRDLEHILEVARKGSHIMLIQDAVLAAVDTPNNRRWRDRLTEAGVTVHALREDLIARGLKRLLDGVDIVDYSGWVELVETYQPVSC
jgi:tRNA 2-thiouridine synthesizing protein B